SAITSVNASKSTEMLQQLEEDLENLFKDKAFTENGGMAALDQAEKLDMKEKVKTLILMFAAGIQTTEITTSQILMALHNTDAGEKVYAEWQAFVGDTQITDRNHFNRLVAEFVLNNDFLNACYLETIRLYPVGGVIKRVAKQDFM